MAVCGDEKERRGIILAKNDLAKKMGIVTAEPKWQALQKCRDLVLVPPHFDLYEKYSHATYDIYTRYTDLIEPFGIDECWLDVTGSQRLYGDGEEIAFKIKETVKNELGLMISVGVSFNKVFAKLGSDMKKPDAITVIPHDKFKSIIWDLPCNDMIGIGKSTNSKLKKYSINTLGDLANTSPDFLSRLLGVNGIYLWRCVNGFGDENVAHQNYKREIKSIGNSITCISDLNNNDQVFNVMLRLSRTVCERLRHDDMSANGVMISIKTSDLCIKEYQMQLPIPLMDSLHLCNYGFKLFKDNFKWEQNVRAVGIRAINLTPSTLSRQLCFLEDNIKIEKCEILEKVSDSLKKRFGSSIIYPLSFKKDIPLPPELKPPS